MKSFLAIGTLAAAIFLGTFFAVRIYAASHACTPPSNEAQHMSSHGWNVWRGDTFQSFTHHGEWICVPRGWMPVGAVSETSDRARFSPLGDGVLVRTDSFVVRDVTTRKHDFVVQVVYPRALDAGQLPQYLAIITRAFDDVGDQYPNASGTPISHTVLLSVGIAGDGHDFDTSIYPEPSLHLSVLVHNLDNPRTEELYLHAIAHLYNRYRTDLIAYKDHQAPLGAVDWEELEASWTELIFRSSKEGLDRHITELSNMYFHNMQHTFSSTDPYPFNNKEIFDAVRYRTAILPDDAKYPDEQLGHYIIAPLTILSTEGRLAVHTAPVHIKDIFIRIHRTNENFFVVLGEYLPAEEVTEVVSEFRGAQLLSPALLLRGATYYRNTLE